MPLQFMILRRGDPIRGGGVTKRSHKSWSKTAGPEFLPCSWKKKRGDRRKKKIIKTIGGKKNIVFGGGDATQKKPIGGPDDGL